MSNVDYENDENIFGENDYGDFQSDEYKVDEFVEQQNIADFVFKDLLRVGIQDDDFIPVGYDIDRIQLDPDLRFRIDVKQYLQSGILPLSESHKESIKRAVNILPYIQYKNPFLYVIGYYFFINVLSEQNNEMRNDNIEYIKKIVYDEKIYTYADVVKYARFWQYVLYPKISKN